MDSSEMLLRAWLFHPLKNVTFSTTVIVHMYTQVFTHALILMRN